MRHIFSGTGILVLVLAISAWATAPGIAAQHGHIEFGHAAGVGSVHFGPHEATVRIGPAVGRENVGPAARPEHVGPAVRPDHVGPAVRPEHGAVVGPNGAFRNPYRDDYFRRFPPGYHPFVLNGAQYYGYYSLPVGFQQLVLNGITYFLFDGVYYQSYIYGGQTVYVVVPAPE